MPLETSARPLERRLSVRAVIPRSCSTGQLQTWRPDLTSGGSIVLRASEI
jgi:hypothetical protein